MAAATITVPQNRDAAVRELSGQSRHVVPDHGGIVDLHHLRCRLPVLCGQEHNGPTPAQVLDIPWFNSICLFSSSLTIVLAEKALEHGNIKRFGPFWFLTIALGVIFLVGTGASGIA